MISRDNPRARIQWDNGRWLLFVHGTGLGALTLPGLTTAPTEATAFLRERFGVSVPVTSWGRVDGSQPGFLLNHPAWPPPYLVEMRRRTARRKANR